jgi:transposase
MPVYPVAVPDASCATLGCWCRDRVARYPSDLTDAQWELLRPEAERVMAELRQSAGRPIVHELRAVLDAVFYVVRNGIEWRALPVDFPPWDAVYAFFQRWSQRGLPQQLVDRLRHRLRVRARRDAQPSATVIDSQSVKAADTVGTGSRGFDAGKKTSDAEGLSSRHRVWTFGRPGESSGFIEGDTLGEAVVEASDHATEEVALSGSMAVTSLPTAVVVASGPW